MRTDIDRFVVRAHRFSIRMFFRPLFSPPRAAAASRQVALAAAEFERLWILDWTLVCSWRRPLEAPPPCRRRGRARTRCGDRARSIVMSKRKAPDKDEEEDVDDPNEDEEAKRRREDREDDEMQERLTKRSSKDRMGCAPTAAPALCCPQPSP